MVAELTRSMDCRSCQPGGSDGGGQARGRLQQCPKVHPPQRSALWPGLAPGVIRLRSGGRSPSPSWVAHRPRVRARPGLCRGEEVQDNFGLRLGVDMGRRRRLGLACRFAFRSSKWTARRSSFTLTLNWKTARAECGRGWPAGPNTCGTARTPTSTAPSCRTAMRGLRTGAAGRTRGQRLHRADAGRLQGRQPRVDGPAVPARNRDGGVPGPPTSIAGSSSWPRASPPRTPSGCGGRAITGRRSCRTLRCSSSPTTTRAGRTCCRARAMEMPHMSIAHTEAGAVALAADVPVGIDLESAERDVPAILPDLRHGRRDRLGSGTGGRGRPQQRGAAAVVRQGSDGQGAGHRPARSAPRLRGGGRRGERRLPGPARPDRRAPGGSHRSGGPFIIAWTAVEELPAPQRQQGIAPCWRNTALVKSFPTSDPTQVGPMLNNQAHTGESATADRTTPPPVAARLRTFQIADAERRGGGGRRTRRRWLWLLVLAVPSSPAGPSRSPGAEGRRRGRDVHVHRESGARRPARPERHRRAAHADRHLDPGRRHRRQGPPPRGGAKGQGGGPALRGRGHALPGGIPAGGGRPRPRRRRSCWSWRTAPPRGRKSRPPPPWSRPRAQVVLTEAELDARAEAVRAGHRPGRTGQGLQGPCRGAGSLQSQQANYNLVRKGPRRRGSRPPGPRCSARRPVIAPSTTSTRPGSTPPPTGTATSSPCWSGRWPSARAFRPT